ncbi:hypothetical protein SPRG_10534 [Saprolegnia parasitica CBS 223.65]|uniref:Fe2OG dioxygenase domain-containing protein n=1 Tax=Saprolegnia parasitica (strain CBS 223.65) TaxID=695850 RepID=A0A067CAC9_SAPPC|nr:hypothetical protein SPRG_10534 [Saprolegnia parasitica CBS 223.65]KDO23757.1 hypothetical protein SPRG_10534 [Saprolegnia parasitica CBS 223.65]|eukprot:XP_012205573.1 hypothetical protein SPRG_10534 [Saprolegnia parasitica CBS 223.65]
MDVLLECQAPYCDWILAGRKTVETRRYPCPDHLIGQRIWLLESPAGSVRQSAVPDQVDLTTTPGLRIVGHIIVAASVRYTSQAHWDADASRHCVPASSGYEWSPDVDVYGWELSAAVATTTAPPISTIARAYRSFFLPVLHVPTVDISDPTSPDVLDAIRAQCATLGFLRVTWKNFPVDVVREAHDATRAFFALSDAEKATASKAATQKTNASFCSTGFRGNTSAYNAGGRESWSCVRPDFDPSAPPRGAYYANPTHFAQAPDPQVPWPAPAIAPTFRPAVTAYYATVDDLAQKLLRMFGQILELEDPESLTKLSKDHASSLNLTSLRFEDDSNVAANAILPAHGDVTSVTILSHDASDGASGTACLQVLNPTYDAHEPHSLRWIALADAAPDAPPSFLVNLGQIMERWSNGRLKATLHRIARPVHPSILRRRQAIVFFCVTNYDAELRPLVGDTNTYTPERMAAYANARLGPFHDASKSLLEAYAIYNKDIIAPDAYIALAQ